MIKRYLCIAIAVVLATGALVGCGKNSAVDTGKLQSAFSSAQESVKTDVNKAVASIQEGKYPEALAQLQQIPSKMKLTDEQQQAINDVIAQVQKQIAAKAEAVQKEAGKAVEGLLKK